MTDSREVRSIRLLQQRLSTKLHFQWSIESCTVVHDVRSLQLCRCACQTAHIVLPNAFFQRPRVCPRSFPFMALGWLSQDNSHRKSKRLSFALPSSLCLPFDCFLCPGMALLFSSATEQSSDIIKSGTHSPYILCDMQHVCCTLLRIKHLY